MLMKHNNTSYEEAIKYYKKVSYENNYNNYDSLKFNIKEM